MTDTATAAVDRASPAADPDALFAALTAPLLPAWADDAACAGMDTEAFFATDIGPAAAVCAACPVREPCRRWAVDHDESGVWGGQTRYQRRH